MYIYLVAQMRRHGDTSVFVFILRLPRPLLLGLDERNGWRTPTERRSRVTAGLDHSFATPVDTLP